MSNENQHTQVKADPLDRMRLQKNAGDKIAAIMEENGFKAKAKTDAVYVWGHHDQHLATFTWISGKGWRLMVRQPTLFANYDLNMAVEEIHRCQSGIEAAEEAWEKFQKSKTNKNWAAYQGAMVAHIFRLYERNTK